MKAAGHLARQDRGLIDDGCLAEAGQIESNSIKAISTSGYS